MDTATRRATSLRAGQFKHLLRVASVTGRMPERDVMLLWAHTTGVRVTELALLEVADVLYPSGAVRPEVYRACDASTDDQPALPASRYQGWQQPFWQANTGGAGACRDRRRGHCTGD